FRHLARGGPGDLLPVRHAKQPIGWTGPGVPVGVLHRKPAMTRSRLRLVIAGKGLALALGTGCSTTEPLEPRVSQVVVEPPSVSLIVEDTARLRALVLDSSGQAVSNRTVSWRSGDTMVATVDGE